MTSTGKVFIRISDNCFPVGSEELTNLASEKTAFQWELIVNQKIRIGDADPEKVETLISELKASEKVSDFIKSKETSEIFEYYQLLCPEDFLSELQGKTFFMNGTDAIRI